MEEDDSLRAYGVLPELPSKRASPDDFEGTENAKKLKALPENANGNGIGSVGTVAKPPPREPEEIPTVLTEAQQAVVDMAVAGDNIFLTGAAGCGKTVCFYLEYFIWIVTGRFLVSLRLDISFLTI